MIEQLVLPPTTVRPLDQPEGTTQPEQFLTASVVTARLANDLSSICEKRRISSLTAIPDIRVKQSPRSVIVSRIVRFCMTVCITSGTAAFSSPDDVVQLRMEIGYSLTEGVW